MIVQRALISFATLPSQVEVVQDYSRRSNASASITGLSVLFSQLPVASVFERAA